MIPKLPDAFLSVPLAHRGLHDASVGVIENSMGAVRAALAAGYGIEIDIQPDGDGQPRAFHDYELRRLTGSGGMIRAQPAEALADVRLSGSGEAIPTLEEVLAEVRGRAPLLIEIKDQDMRLGPNVGPLEAQVAAALTGYTGPVAAMSFNPHSAAALAEAAPDLPCGLVTDAFAKEDWPLVPQERLDELASLDPVEALAVSFISHDRRDLSSRNVARLRAQGHVILCWTVKSLEQERQARTVAHNITFEGYPAAIGG